MLHIKDLVWWTEDENINVGKVKYFARAEYLEGMLEFAFVFKYRMVQASMWEESEDTRVRLLLGQLKACPYMCVGGHVHPRIPAL